VTTPQAQALRSVMPRPAAMSRSRARERAKHGGAGMWVVRECGLVALKSRLQFLEKYC